jgi:hypothetical protein
VDFLCFAVSALVLFMKVCGVDNADFGLGNTFSD